MSDGALSAAAWRAVVASMESDPPGDPADPPLAPELLARLQANHYRATAANLAPRPAACNPLRHYRKKKGSSRYRGVCWQASAGKWRAQLQGRTYLGLFATEEAAARAHDAAAFAAFGGRAALNFPGEVPGPRRTGAGQGSARASGWHRQNKGQVLA